MLRGEPEFQACWPMVTDCVTSSLRPHCSSLYLRHSGGHLPFYYYNYLQQQQQQQQQQQRSQVPRLVTHQLKSAEASLSSIFMHTASSTPPMMALEEVVDRNKNALLMLPPPLSRSPGCSSDTSSSSDATDHLSARMTTTAASSPNPVTSRSSSLSSPPSSPGTGSQHGLTESKADHTSSSVPSSPLLPPPSHSHNPCSPVTLFPRRPDSTSSVSSTASTASSSLDSAAVQRHYHLQSSAASMAILQQQHYAQRQPPNNNNNNNEINLAAAENNRTLKFSIENILRPDFGRVAPLGSENSNDGGQSETNVTSSGRKRHHHHHHHNHHHNHHHQSGHSHVRNKVSSTTSATTTASNSSNTNSKPNAKSTSTKAASSPGGAVSASSPTELPPVKSGSDSDKNNQMLWPAWVYCTRYSDRPSSGRSPRSRRIKKKDKKPEEKRPRTAFTNEQLARLKKEFQENRYLTEKRRQDLAKDLQLNESQIKIWFQNKRAKIKKASGQRNGLALHLMAQGLYNHSTVHPGPNSPLSASGKLKSDDEDKDKHDDDLDDDMDDDDDDQVDIDMVS